jgi:dihydroorotate dehydrogenase (NAD+) catalytic subunit
MSASTSPTAAAPSSQPDLSRRIGSLTLRNPVLTASGTFGYASEYDGVVDFSRIGGVITKGISPAPRPGTKQPRIWETAAGMLNAIGLENVGREAFEAEKLPYLRSIDCAVVVNYFATTVDDFGELAAGLGALDGVDALEANISCPNVKEGGRQFGTDPAAAAAVTKISRGATDKPIIIKLSPDVTDIAVIARAVCDAGADAVTVANSYSGMAIDVRTRKPRLSFGRGGLTGPAVRPLSMRLVYDCAAALRESHPNVAVIASGGAATWEHAAEYILAGASAVQIGTATFLDPAACVAMADGLRDWAVAEGVASLDELVGAVRMDAW